MAAERTNGSRGSRDLNNGTQDHIRVLMYHRVVEDEPCASKTRRYCIEYRTFENQLKYLDRQGFTAVTFEDIHLHRMGEFPLPKKPVVITFDDGYEDTYELAAPLLSEYGMKGVIFVLGDRSIRENRWDAAPDAPPAPLMSDSQILELHRAGFEIGSHTLTHPRLTDIRPEEAWEEISRSRMLLEILINAPIRAFSYPYGLHDGALRRMAQEAGYEFAVGVYSGGATFSSDLHDIRRIHPASDAFGLGFSLQMMAPYQRYSAMRWRIQRLITPGVQKTE